MFTLYCLFSAYETNGSKILISQKRKTLNGLLLVILFHSTKWVFVIYLLFYHNIFFTYCLVLILSHVIWYIQIYIFSLCFYIQQAAHGMVRPIFLGEQLQACEMTPDRANVFVEHWTTHAKQIVETLRQQSLSEKQVRLVNSFVLGSERDWYERREKGTEKWREKREREMMEGKRGIGIVKWKGKERDMKVD